MTIYKVLNLDGTSCNGGYSVWSLPTKNEDGSWTPGEWMPDVAGDIIPCENGYHLCQDAQVVQWLGPLICEAEYEGESVACNDKIVVRRARLVRVVEGWHEWTARALARWCALQVAHLWQNPMPDIRRQFLETGDAACAAARAAAWDAASAAACAAQYAEFCRLCAEEGAQ